MNALLNYFEAIPALHRGLLLAGGITIFWLLEGAVPLFNFNYKKLKHALPNLFFTLTTIIINFLLAFVLVKTSQWVTLNNFGILHWLPQLPIGLYVLLGILLLDFIGAYLVHYIEHRVPPLWMIHLVHHTDHKVDTTTANRHHPLESVVRFLFTLLGVFIVGAPIAIIMLYQSLSLISTQFTHANIKMPYKLDYFLSYIIVTPNMHKVHHHYKLPYTDSNFGNIFSIWDRLLGTYQFIESSKIIYGVDTFYDEKENSSLKALLRQPFQKYRKPKHD